jgi:DNA-binding NarL/FixJ family response regulator
MPAAPAQPRPLRVVLVDDEPQILQMMKALLAETEGVDVVGSARDGASALRLIAAEAPDVAVLDLVMPRVDGLELARQVRDQYPTMRIVVVSGYAGPETSALMKQFGVTSVLSKPVRRATLVDAIRGTTLPPIAGDTSAS